MSARPDLARVAVVGTSCSGKTTFARSLSCAIDAPYTELDALYWGPNWQERPFEEFRAGVDAATSAPLWVLDGNYSAVRDLIWRRATALIWLNYSFSLIFSRALTRTFRRTLTRERLFAGNRESLLGIVDPEWIPWWVLRTFWRRRRDYPPLFRRAEFAHLQVLEFTHPEEGNAFLFRLGDQ
jgi:adenylate kinase family enzyme